jgi:hypothetical protein
LKIKVKKKEEKEDIYTLIFVGWSYILWCSSLTRLSLALFFSYHQSFISLNFNDKYCIWINLVLRIKYIFLWWKPTTHTIDEQFSFTLKNLNWKFSPSLAFNILTNFFYIDISTKFQLSLTMINLPRGDKMSRPTPFKPAQKWSRVGQLRCLTQTSSMHLVFNIRNSSLFWYIKILMYLVYNIV